MKKKETILLASDHNAVKLKQQIVFYLKNLGYQPIDLGPYEDITKVDYNVYANQAGIIISNNQVSKGIFMCGTGTGFSIVLNRHQNVRAVLAHSVEVAKKSKEHNKSNALCLSAWLLTENQNLEIIDAWLDEPYAEGRHVKRVERIDKHSGIVLCNGCFDVLTIAHIQLLEFAKSQGTHLVVALDSDERVKSLKGENRPINNENNRRKLLEALHLVDEVLIFNTKEELEDLYIKTGCNTIVRGGEYTASEIRQRDNIPDNIEIKIFPYIEGISTTNTLKRIKDIEKWEKKTVIKG